MTPVAYVNTAAVAVSGALTALTDEQLPLPMSEGELRVLALRTLSSRGVAG